LSLSTSARDVRYEDFRENYFEKLQYRLVTNIMNKKTVDAATFKQKETKAQRVN
jgi:hypothetical protein